MSCVECLANFTECELCRARVVPQPFAVHVDKARSFGRGILLEFLAVLLTDTSPSTFSLLSPLDRRKLVVERLITVCESELLLESSENGL
jgi:hypothetical protein